MEAVYEISFIIKRNKQDNAYVTYLVAENAKQARKRFDNTKWLGLRKDWTDAHRYHVTVKRINDISPTKIGFTYPKEK